MRAGFSLIEVIVSTVLVGVLGTIVVFFFISTAQPLRQANHRELAQLLASSQLEIARSRGAADLPPGDYPQPDVKADDILYHVDMKVETVAGYQPQELRLVRVEVSWTEKERNLSVVLQRRVCDAPF